MKTVDLFCGCGGLSLGFQKAGFNLIAAFDSWKPAVEVYKTNFNHPVFCKDLNDVDTVQIIEKLQPDVIVGGPPCQDFSSAGKRDESLGRANLTIRYAEIICRIKPEWFVMENVSRVVKSNVLRSALKLFKDNGYGLTSVLLDASLCGVPQSRKRFFLIGQLRGEHGNLETYLSHNQSPHPMTVFDYLGYSLGVEYFYRHPRSYQRRAIFSIYEPSPTIRGVNRPIPKNYKKHSGDACDLTENVRPLTTIERSYIQTFPKSFKFVGTKTNLEQMIGNAVPVNLAEYVGKAILKYIQSENAQTASLVVPYALSSESLACQLSLFCD